MFQVIHIPGLAEAVEKETEIRNLAFIGLPESINGIPAMPLTASHLLFLEGCRNPFMTGGEITPASALQFLWIVSPRFEPRRSLKAWFFKQILTRQCLKLDFEATCKAIYDYIDEAFMDAPPASEGGPTKPWASWAAIFAHQLSTTGCMDWQAAIHTPIKVSFQLSRCQRKAQDGKAVFFSPSDKVIGDYLDELNKQKS
jgi:hypothetical protein